MGLWVYGLWVKALIIYKFIQSGSEFYKQPIIGHGQGGHYEEVNEGSHWCRLIGLKVEGLVIATLKYSRDI